MDAVSDEMSNISTEASINWYNAESFSNPSFPWCRILTLFWRDSRWKIKKPENHFVASDIF